MFRAVCSRVGAGTAALHPFARSAHITGNQVRPGVAIELDGKLYRVVKSQSVKPGKGVAYMQAELKEIITGHKINRRFRSSESVKKAPLTKDRPFQFLYNEGNKLVLMEPSTFEQLEVGTDILQENQLKYLSEGTIVAVQVVEGVPLWLHLPDHVVHVVEKVAPGTANGNEATLTNGTQVQVPASIEVGDYIKISSETGQFVEKVPA